MPSSAGRGDQDPPFDAFTNTSLLPESSKWLQNQSFPTCLQALFLRSTSPHTHWAITPSGYRSGGISGVNSHTLVSSSFPATLFYLPCLWQQWSRVGTWRGCLCWPCVSSLQGRKQQFLKPIHSSALLPAFLAAWDHARDSPQWYRNALVMQGEDNSPAFCFLSYPSKRPLASETLPWYSQLFQHCSVGASDQLWNNSVCDPSSQRHLQNLSCPNGAPRTYKGYNDWIILHVSFSLNPLQEKVA